MPVDLTAMLKEWGVTMTVLSVAGTALLVIFVVSFREFASWFVRVNTVIKNQEEIIDSLRRIEVEMQKKVTASSIIAAVTNERMPKETSAKDGPLVPHEFLTPPPQQANSPKERFQLHT